MNPKAIAKLLETSRHYFSLPMSIVARPVEAAEKYRHPRSTSRQGGSRRSRHAWHVASRSEVWG